MDLRDRIDNDFTYHAPKGDQVERYAAWRGTLRDTAHYLRTIAPESRELSVALTKLEEAMFWGNAAIARNE